jgi:hypothetical protein
MAFPSIVSAVSGISSKHQILSKLTIWIFSGSML